MKIKGRTRAAMAGLMVASIVAVAAPVGAEESERRELLLQAAQENTVDNTATLPVFAGIDADGETFEYVVTESSNSKDAERRGVNRSPKLANAKNSAAVQRGRFDSAGVLYLEDTVDFAPARVVTPGPGGFPPLAAAPGAVGQAGYSPLVHAETASLTGPGGARWGAVGIIVNCPMISIVD